MYDTIIILRDVVLEAQTAARDLEYDDTLIENLRYIEELTNAAIENLCAQLGGIDAA